MAATYSDVKEKLNNEVTEARIDDALSRMSNPDPSDEPRRKWYRASYPRFLEVFQRTAHTADPQAWVERIACVFSWIGSIPTPRLEPEFLEALVDLERRFSTATLWEIGIARDKTERGGASEVHASDVLLHEPEGSKNAVPFSDFLRPANKLLNGSDRWEQTTSTSSKLMHFMFPSLFPILDGNVATRLGLGTPPNANGYCVYLMGLRELLQENTGILERCRAQNRHPLRVIDQILFDPAEGES